METWDNRPSNIWSGSLIERPFIWQILSLSLSLCVCAVPSTDTQYALFLRPWSSFLGWHYWHFPPPSCGPSSHLSWLLLNSQLSFAAVDQWLSTPPVSYWQSKQPSSSKWGPRSLSLSPSIRAARLLWALGPLLGQSIHHSTHQKCAHFLIGSQLTDVCVKKHRALLSFQKCGGTLIRKNITLLILITVVLC